MQNILRYLTPEILAWESGNIQEVRPLGSVLCLPDGREWYAFGFTRDAYYGSLSLLMASSRRECGEWARANSPAAIRFGAQRYLIDTTGYRMFSGNDDQLFRLPLLLRDRPPMPDPGQSCGPCDRIGFSPFRRESPCIFRENAVRYGVMKNPIYTGGNPYDPGGPDPYAAIYRPAL